MILAAFETSTPRGSVALLSPGGDREEALDPGAPHSETLLPALLGLLLAAGHRPSELEALAVGVGPGAFTGLRVGLATAQGWARASGGALVAVPSPDALALPFLEEGGAVLTLCDARKGEVYAAFYPGLDPLGLPRRQGEVALLAPGALPGWWEGLGAPSARMVGNAVGAGRAHLPRLPQAGSPSGEFPRASAVARLGRILLGLGRTVDPASLVPHYVRPPDALPPAPPLPR